ncbi:hypothetical protein IE077_003136 [Cardiosporidium cionae]|uniref:Uncharacterized protein n=1 Tax=Cardiosporidium cionae TaxID=476202 RepID=A0ABQ7JF77_9APIC|nr:hypothetical protein IE077_003136 [Cardiosporidium cionae]|eukprot:KAF8822667.1 hypothetical protein IE077_003136 [Cardiosporidium cionae]
MGEKEAYKILFDANNSRHMAIQQARKEASEEIEKFSMEEEKLYKIRKEMVEKECSTLWNELAMKTNSTVRSIISCPALHLEEAANSILGCVTDVDLSCLEIAIKLFGTDEQLFMYHKLHNEKRRRSSSVGVYSDTLIELEDGRVFVRHENLNTHEVSFTHHGSYWILQREAYLRRTLRDKAGAARPHF